MTQRASHTQSIALLVCNVCGAIGYDVAASRGGWKIPEELAAGIDVTTGEPFIWFMSIFPILATFLVFNVVWVGFTLLRRQRPASLYLIFAALAWLVAVKIDFAHH